MLGAFWTSATVAGVKVDRHAPPPESFYVVAEKVSDVYPSRFDYVLDLSPSAEGTSLRWIRVARRQDWCPGVTVKARSTVLRAPIGAIARPNPCSLSETEVHDALRRETWVSLIDDTVGFGIVARCGAVTKTFHLPLAQTVNMKKLPRPVAKLYYIYFDIIEAAFPHAGFYDIPIEEDLDLQRAGSELLAELRSGRFDAGRSGGSWADTLAEYRGIREDVVQRPRGKVWLLDRGADHLQSYLAPEYPMVARRARLEGDVMLGLTIDRDTGAVRAIRADGPNSLLEDVSRKAAEAWRFKAEPDTPEFLRVVLRFALFADCQ
jgi:hypothetical protein